MDWKGSHLTDLLARRKGDSVPAEANVAEPEWDARSEPTLPVWRRHLSFSFRRSDDVADQDFGSADS